MLSFHGKRLRDLWGAGGEVEKGGSDDFNDPPSFSSSELANVKEGMLSPGHKILIPLKWKLRLPLVTEGSPGTRKTDRKGSQAVGPTTDLEVL